MILILIFIFGLIIGSFLNALICRLHLGESVLKGRSRCPECKHQLAWYDNIPLLSFVLLKAKCRYCHKRIDIQYPLVEFFVALLFVVAYLQLTVSGRQLNFPFSIFHFPFIYLLRDWFFIAVLIIVFVYDLKYYLILDKVVLPAGVIALAVNVILGYNWYNLLLAGLVAGGFFMLQFIVSKGKWIGGGDIRLGLLMGLMLGWPQVLVALFLAYILGAIAGIGLIISKNKTLQSKVPFGTFLSVATFIVLFYGREVIDFYFGLF